jgi:hypothetical protein
LTLGFDKAIAKLSFFLPRREARSALRDKFGGYFPRYLGLDSLATTVRRAITYNE